MACRGPDEDRVFLHTCKFLDSSIVVPAYLTSLILRSVVMTAVLILLDELTDTSGWKYVEEMKEAMLWFL